MGDVDDLPMSPCTDKATQRGDACAVKVLGRPPNCEHAWTCANRQSRISTRGWGRILCPNRKKRLLLTDDQRRLLVVKGKSLGRKALMELTTIVTPDTILRWHRTLAARKRDYSDRTVGNVLKEHDIEPAPERQRQNSWKTFLKAHWEVLASIDFTTIEVWIKGRLRNNFRIWIAPWGGRSSC